MKINRIKHFFLGAGAVTLLLTPSLGHAAALTPNSVIAAINQERGKNNLPDLVTEEHLMQAAKDKLSDMSQKHYFDHASPTGEMPWDFLDAAGYPYRTSGENLAQDYFNTSSLINAWEQSDTHRSNMLSSVFKDVGAAIGTVDGHTVIVTLFGATSLTPKVAGESTQAPENAAQQGNHALPGSQPVQSATIIPNTTTEQNETHTTAARPFSQPFFTSIYLLLSLFAAAAILSAFWRT